MPTKTVERVFTRRSFLFFLFIAPAAVLTLLAIIVTSQYKQLQSVVSSHQAVTPFVWDDAGRARLDTLAHRLQIFSTGAGSDSLHLSASDLNLLAAASPLLQKQRLYAKITATDSLLVVETTQSIEDQHRGLSWIFQKIVPREFQYLNARLLGVPAWKAHRLDFALTAGYLNEAKVPRAALDKRGGMSPRDFVDSAGMPVYLGIIDRLDTAYFVDRGVALVRRTPASDAAKAARQAAAEAEADKE